MDFRASAILFLAWRDLKRAGCTFAVFALTLLAVWLLVGCSTPKIEYRPTPAMLIPPAPTLPTIKAEDLACLSDDVYLRLATRDRVLRQYTDELGALLGVSK
jgi:hypothetical protein